MKKDSKYSLIVLLLIPIGIAINYVGGQMVILLKLPFFVDAIGTILVGALAGPLLGGVTGLGTNLLLGITNPDSIPFAIVNLAIGVTAGLCAKRKMFTNIKGLFMVTILTWLATVLTATPITVILYGGVQAGGVGLITAVIAATGQNIWRSVFTTQIITQTLDKAISVLIVRQIVKSIPTRTLLKFPLGKLYIADENLTEMSDIETDWS